ncbi:VOC family protein [Polaromonas sp. LjRoot131]|uniref:VOC family protein n=1 Tax=Polaromonas sp. LjRoot131 TaxID=3342262 RepID=UPI003ED02E77
MNDQPMKAAMTEVLCARTPAVLHCADLRRALAFYRDCWGFSVQHSVPGVIAVLTRESVPVQLWQRRADMAPQHFACRLLVDNIEQWHMALQSAPGQAPHALAEQEWGTEWGVSDCEGNRLQLVQSAPHAARRRARA